MVNSIRSAIRRRNPDSCSPGLAWVACLLLGICLSASAARPAHARLDGVSARLSPQHPISAGFDPTKNETHVDGQVAADLCIALMLPQEWRLTQDTEAIRLQAARSGDELLVSIRSEADLRAFPQVDMAGRDAAALQQEYEAMLGRPAQAVAHQPTNRSGVSRWSATWVDANFVNASHSFSIETFIVESPGNRTVELTLTKVAARDSYDAEIAAMLSSLQLTAGTECGASSSAAP
jgi:hypothetical protein